MEDSTEDVKIALVVDLKDGTAVLQSAVCSDIDVEFKGIDFAADVEYPTLNHSLTQGNIIFAYLEKNAKVSDFVVFSTGAHDTTGECRPLPH